ncbi:MAG TPA: ChbG/HpnK family deacetylase [Opitutaceae bacterium]|nr:ChbG/HpnK family deacetylase [Opitutaceae bacterium]
MPQTTTEQHIALPPLLIVRGDDMGSSQAANEACMRCAREGVMTSVEVMPVTPWFPQAVRLLREIPDFDVGVHLALTSEWDDMKWHPFTPCPSLVDESGCFRPVVTPHRHYVGRSHAENRWSLAEIERELRAQIELSLAMLPQISHVTTHMEFRELDPSVAALVDHLADSYGIDAAQRLRGLRPASYAGPKQTSAEKTQSFVRMVEALEPGGRYLFIDHPGLDTPELRGTGHGGYDDVAIDRQGATDCLVSPSVRAALEAKSVRLCSYRTAAGHQGEHSGR